MLEIFVANSIRILVERQELGSFSINYLEYKRIVVENKVLQSILNESTLSPSIESAIFDLLEK